MVQNSIQSQINIREKFNVNVEIMTHTQDQLQEMARRHGKE